MLNKIEINTKSQSLDLDGLKLHLYFEDVEEVMYDYSDRKDGSDMQLDEMIIKGGYVYNFTHHFEQNYKFDFYIRSGDIKGNLQIPMDNEHNYEIGVSTTDKKYWDNHKKGYLPKWNAVTINTGGIRTDDLDNIVRFERGLKIVQHLTMLVESWKSLKSVADLKANQEKFGEEK